MNVAAKILLTIYLEGVLSQVKEEMVIPYQKSADFNATDSAKEFEKKCNTIVESGVVRHLARVPSVATQRMVFTEEVYDFWTGGNIPEWIPASRPYTWTSLSANEKIKAHCERIANGKPFTFDVIDD